MKWDRQQSLCFLLYLKEIYAQFVETNVLVKHNIYHELKLIIMDFDLQITWKHPVLSTFNTEKAEGVSEFFENESYWCQNCVTLQDAEHVLHKCMADYDSEGHDTDTETNSNNVSRV